MTTVTKALNLDPVTKPRPLHIAIMVAGFVVGVASALLLGHVFSLALELVFLSDGDLSGLSAIIGWGVLLVLLMFASTGLVGCAAFIKPPKFAVVHVITSFAIPLVIEVIDVAIRIVHFLELLGNSV